MITLTIEQYADIKYLFVIYCNWFDFMLRKQSLLYIKEAYRQFLDVIELYSKRKNEILFASIGLIIGRNTYPTDF